MMNGYNRMATLFQDDIQSSCSCGIVLFDDTHSVSSPSCLPNASAVSQAHCSSIALLIGLYCVADVTFIEQRRCVLIIVEALIPVYERFVITGKDCRGS